MPRSTPTARAWSASAPSPVLWTFTGASSDHLGWAIANAGLVGPAGVHAIAVGAPSTGTSGPPGRVYVFDTANGSLVRTLFGAAANDQFGYAVGLAGDINADGRDDLISRTGQ